MCSDLNVFSYVATAHVCNFYMGPFHKFYSTPLNYRIGRMKPFSSPLTRSPIVHNRTWCNTQIAASRETTGHRQHPWGRRKSMFRHFWCVCYRLCRAAHAPRNWFKQSAVCYVKILQTEISALTRKTNKTANGVLRDLVHGLTNAFFTFKMSFLRNRRKM
jgi:hypothetical protein